MAGSRKGEHRGGAKPGHVATTVASPAGKVKKQRKAPRAPKRSEEYYREITRVISGEDMRKDIEPRDVMLEAMRYFHAEAMEERSMKAQLLAQAARLPPDDPRWVTVNQMLGDCQSRIERMHIVATDTAFKVAPYTHAKLSSIEITGPDKGPVNIIHTLLDDIHKANRGRPTWAPPELELEAVREEP